MVSFAVLVTALFSSASARKDQFRGDAVCRNHHGAPVDWWVILKDEGPSMQYVYYDSLMAKLDQESGRKAIPMGLSPDMVLDDIKTSPLIRTMYDSRPFSGKEMRGKKVRDQDNTVFLAVNDQPPPLEIENGDKAVTLKDKDAYGYGVEETSAHTKLWLATQVHYAEEADMSDDDEVISKTYVIQHSLPQFPWMPASSSSIWRKSLPDDPRDMFRSNATNPQAKAQHFFCTSHSSAHTLRSGSQLPYQAENLSEHLSKGDFPLVSILHYLRTIHAAVIGFNYVPWLKRMEVYHSLLNTAKVWSPKKIIPGVNDDFGSLNQARSFSSDMAMSADGSPHLFPLWPSMFRNVVRNGRIVKRYKAKRLSSLRISSQNFWQDCRVFEKQGRKDPGCLGSSSIKTTNRHYSLDVNLLYKNGLVELDIWDDLVAPLTVEKSTFLKALNSSSTNSAEESALIVQSWMDHTTLGDHAKQLPGAKVWVKNSNGISLPISGCIESKLINSAGQDHSKWAIGTRTGDVGPLPYLWCAGDLNRTKRHAKLAKVNYGRGGGVWCTSDWALASLFWDLRPRVQSSTDFANFDFTAAWPLMKEFPQKMGAVLRYHSHQRHYFIGHLHDSSLTIGRYLSPFRPVNSNATFPILRGTDADQIIVKYDPADIDISSDDDEDDDLMDMDDDFPTSPTRTVNVIPKYAHREPVSIFADSLDGTLQQTPIKQRKLFIKSSSFKNSLGFESGSGLFHSTSTRELIFETTPLANTCPTPETLYSMLCKAGLFSHLTDVSSPKTPKKTTGTPKITPKKKNSNK